ncbi:MAG: hypothetical protein KGM43_01520 [Planctomycetota bacterium]|nr:hypothetical protein [Planctomycetota bacterium]
MKRIAAAGVTRVVSFPNSTLAFATPQQARGMDCGLLEILDLVKGRSLGV